MNKKRVERLIPEAMGYIEKNFVKNAVVPKVYQGYLASFGPTVISSGLLLAVTFNSDEKKTENKKIMDMLFSLIKEEAKSSESSLLDFIKKDDNYKNYYVKHMILDASIACKMAIRTFTLKD
jgi:CRISPR-associated protein Cmr5